MSYDMLSRSYRFLVHPWLSLVVMVCAPVAFIVLSSVYSPCGTWCANAALLVMVMRLVPTEW